MGNSPLQPPWPAAVWVLMTLVPVLAAGGEPLRPPAAPPAKLGGFRVDLTHVDHGGNFTKQEILRRALSRSKHRLGSLAAGAEVLAAGGAGPGGKMQAPVHAGSGEFIMDLAIGTPPVAFPAILDTGSDLIWTQCKPCSRCYGQATEIFDPSASKTFSKLPCSSKLCQALPSAPTCDAGVCGYVYSYGDSSSTRGALATETFTFGGSAAADEISVPGVAFGCSDRTQGKGFRQAAGLVGLGRGPLSLSSQLNAGRFSYCLTKLDESKKSPLLLGSLAKLSSRAQSTSFLRNPNQPTFYYLAMKGITVGTTTLSVSRTAFALDADGAGGLIIDSGTSITYLEAGAFELLKNAFVPQMQLSVGDGSAVGLDLCFLLPSSGSADGVAVPKLTFHFDGADMELPPENYMILDSVSGQLCLMMGPSSSMSILGNFQQMNFHILYDLEGGKLAFEPAQCDLL